MRAEDLKRRLASGEEIDLIDVREKEEYEKGPHIPGTRNVPMGQVFLDAHEGTLPKGKKIVTICRTGGRCEIVARELKQKGYDIEHLEGGIDAWQNG
ncbi:rhodanese-like domain-containing protein [Patescibacteria group bacterium]|nr:rhodanese-like domain-containing protein [Patescibacteria group bacterium]